MDLNELHAIEAGVAALADKLRSLKSEDFQNLPHDHVGTFGVNLAVLGARATALAQKLGQKGR